MNTESTKSSSAFNKIPSEIKRLWPAAKGSLAQITKPCIRPNCVACKEGRKHKAYIYAYTMDGKRKCMYVPKELVPVLRKAIANGREVEKKLFETGVDLIKDYRGKRK